MIDAETETESVSYSTALVQVQAESEEIGIQAAQEDSEPPAIKEDSECQTDQPVAVSQESQTAEEAKEETQTATAECQTEPVEMDEDEKSAEKDVSIESLSQQLKQKEQQNDDSEMAYQSQINQFMDLLKQERLEQTRLRASIMESIRENKVLRQKLQEEYKRKFQVCASCVSLKQKLRKCQEETELTQELYFGQKTQFNEESHKLRLKINDMRQENQKLRIENREITQEKQTIMRKLVQTMLKYEQETTFASQAKAVHSKTFRGEIDYISIPTSAKDGSSSKVILPATKEMIRASRLQQHSTPGGSSSAMTARVPFTRQSDIQVIDTSLYSEVKTKRKHNLNQTVVENKSKKGNSSMALDFKKLQKERASIDAIIFQESKPRNIFTQKKSSTTLKSARTNDSNFEERKSIRRTSSPPKDTNVDNSGKF